MARAVKWAFLWGTLVMGATRPNFIVFLTDDQDVLLGGFSGMPVSNDFFARGGMTFQHGYVDTPICCPSRTSTLSGRYGHNLNQTGLGNWCGQFTGYPLENHTWVTALKDAGYVTSMSGKYHNAPPQGYVPKGWDDFFSLNNECQYFNNTFNSNGTHVVYGSSPTDYMTSLIGNRSLAFLRNAVLGDAPFLAYIAPHASHMPATPAPWYANTPIDGGAPRTPAFNASGAGKHWVISELAPLSDAMARGVDAIYAQRIRSLLSVDDIVRDVAELLTAAGRLNDTFFFFTSDHGYNLGTFRLSVEKFHHLENDLRVPFLARGPGVPAGATTDALVNNVDIGATILDLAGVAGPETDGRSFAPALRGGAPQHGGSAAPARDRLLFEYGGWGTGYVERGPCNVSCGMCPERGPQHMQLLDAPSNTYSGLRIRNATHDWTYAEFRGHGGPAYPLVPSATNWTELYDNAADEFQLTNLAPMTPAAVLAALHAELWAVATCEGAECP